MEVPSARSQAAARWCWYALLVVLAAGGIALGLNPRRAGDLRIYLTATQRFWRGLDLYPVTDGPISFKYAPAAAWLFTPLAAFPPKFAAVLWNLASVAALAFAAARWRASVASGSRYGVAPWAPIAATLALAQSFFLELFYGQVDLVILALLIWPFTPAGRRAEIWSGLCLAVAALLKPPAALALAAAVVMRRRRAVLAAALCYAVLHVPLVARFGWSGAVDQMRAWLAMLESTTSSWALGYNPQGLPTLLLSLVYSVDGAPPRAAQAIANIASTAAVIAAPLLARLDDAGLLAIVYLGSALASPLAWRANFVLAWPLVVVLLSIRAGPARRAAACAAVGLVAGVEWLVSESVLGPERARAVLAARPWGIAFLILTVVAVAALRRQAQNCGYSRGARSWSSP
jgi:hypothetical protein